MLKSIYRRLYSGNIGRNGKHFARLRGSCLYTKKKPDRFFEAVRLSYFEDGSYCESDSVHLSLSSGLNFQGAKLFSILLNITFHSCGALLSSMMR